MSIFITYHSPKNDIQVYCFIIVVMFSIFQKKTIRKVSFEDVLFSIKYPEQFIIINTMPIYEQSCLIKSTIDCNKEEQIFNDLLNTYNLHSKHIIIYGKNTDDETTEKKYHQILGLGFKNVFLYQGGMFEWLLLQDIYGKNEFPTTTFVLDILKYKPQRQYAGRLT